MEPQAVVGFAFKMPQGIADEDAFWDVLVSGRNLSTKWPASRANIEAFYEEEKNVPNKLPTMCGHFVDEDITSFDAPFFSITSQEAAAMDPQQRWILETTFHAFENAGIPIETLRGSRTGVFAGSMSDDFTRLMAKDPDTMPRTAITGTSPSLLANKVSWFYDLNGPSMHIDSACSSSLTALDLACQSVRNGTSSQAVVIGSSIMLTPESSTLLSNMSFLSRDGVSYSFDHRRNGYARGEGVIVIIIKPISLAVQDQDVIRAVIRSTLSNQDGRTPGLTQPSAKAQEQLIRDVYRRIDLDFASTRYVEAHGTGTPVGDPIEIAAIMKVFGSYRSIKSPLYVGSVKANIGHLEGGSGLASILKSVMILEKGIMPPNALLEQVNPEILDGSNALVIPDTPIEWPTQGLRRISVNSFGFGGSNCHVILDDAYTYLLHRSLLGLHNCKILASHHGTTSSQDRKLSATSLFDGSTKAQTSLINGWHKEAVPSPPRSDDNCKESSSQYLLVWSANDESAVTRMMESYRDYLSTEGLHLPHLSYTLANRRSVMDWRAFAVVSPVDTLLSSIEPTQMRPIKSSKGVSIAIVFTGQGAQYARMGMELLHYPVFNATLRAADRALRNMGCPWSLFDALRDDEKIHSPQYSQPLCTAIQLALLSLLESLDLRPTAVIGHSSGEIAAAYAVGALTLPSAMKVAFYRGSLAGQLMVKSCIKSAMMSVAMSETAVQLYLQKKSYATLGSDIHVACINSPFNITLSGDESVIDALKTDLDTEGVFAAKLNTGVAYHSPAMREVADTYREAIGYLEKGPMASQSPIMISSVTGQAIHPSTLSTANYWVENLISPVRFSEAVSTLVNDQLAQDKGIIRVTDMLEIGPHSALQRPIKDTLHTLITEKSKAPRYHSVLRKSKSAQSTLLGTVGELFCLGYLVSIDKANAGPNESGDALPKVLTNTPKYPFSRSQKYWKESRIARDFRHRSAVPSDTLGTRVHDWNPLEPRWRNFLSSELMPWIADHKVSNTVIFPGAGMLIMATEAVKQMASANGKISGYHIQEAHFMNPMIVSDTSSDPTESMIHLRKLQNSFEKETSRYEILIYAYHQSRWTHCFRAIIQAQFDEDKSPMGAAVERRLESSRLLHKYRNAQQSCGQVLNAQEFYDYCHKHGFEYGDTFQLLEDIRWDDRDLAVARIKRTPENVKSQSLVHPSILDAAFHLSLVQTSQGLAQSVDTMVPQQLFNAWVSARGWDESSSMRLLSQMTHRNKSSSETTITTLSDSGEPLCTIERLVTAAVTSGNDPEVQIPKDGLIHRIVWKPQLGLQTRTQLANLCGTDFGIGKEAEMILFYSRLGSALLRAAKSTLENLSKLEFGNAPSHLTKLASSMRLQISSFEDHSELPSDAEVETIFAESEICNPSWSIFPVVARQLREIFTGEKDALDIVYSKGLADRFYRSIFDHICDQRFFRFIELLTHENPGLRILEVGAGFGGMTRNVLSYLQLLEQKTGTSRFSEYIYTDISPTFFDEARNEFKDNRITFQTFDVERDGVTQGIENAQFDLVIAGGVIHATKLLDRTLTNVRHLLKPGGHLVLVEITAPGSIHANVGFGVLPGWWLSEEDYRAHSPAITEDQWDQALLRTGFSGNDLVLRDYQDDSCHFSSLIVSTAKKQSPLGPCPKLLLLVNDQMDDQLYMAQQLCQQLGSAEVLPFRRVADTEIMSDDIVISLLDVGVPFLATMSEADYVATQSFIRKATNICWVTAMDPKDGSYASYNSIDGLIRTVRAESIEKRIVTLAVESEEPAGPMELAGYISAVLGEFALSDHPELEFKVRDGYIESGRLIEDVDLNRGVEASIHPQHKYEPLGAGPPVELAVGTPGLLDTLEFIQDSVPVAELGPGEVEIEAKAWALSFRDIIVALGRLEGSDLGWDAAGIVTKVGPGCDLVPGDRVGLGAPGSLRTHIRANAESIFRIPGNMTFEEAASFINPACTAYHCLVNTARLQKGEKVLIHSGAGATGQMAIWVAKLCGAEIFTTVGSESKKQLLVQRFGLDPSHIFYSRDPSFAQGITRVTEGYGVDVVLNSLSGDCLRASWNVIAPYGRFVEIGKADITSNSTLAMGKFQQNVSFFAVDLHHMAKTKPGFVSELMHKVLDLIVTKAIQYPHPIHIFGSSELESAFRTMQSGVEAGRIIIRVEPSAVVPKFTKKPSEWTLDANASYVVVGGLGGLGRAICQWMVNKGAKYLIVLSRSGATTDVAIKTVHDFEKRGVKIAALACDAASREALAATLDTCASTMPPIKGCINSAMALQDGIFDTLPYSRWSYTMRSKLDTSWNLHDCLPKGMDFFILLSSLSGLYGTISLSNYAAGCTYQDALARYRNSIGENATSLDIGWMRTIGIIAETALYQRNRERARDMRPIEEVELLSLLEFCCDPTSPYAQFGADSGQVLIGATTPAFFLRRGEEPIAQVASRMFSGFSNVAKVRSSEGQTATDEHVVRFSRTSDPAEQAQIVVDALTAKVARALSVETEYIDAGKPLSRYGVDSLMAVELRNWLINAFHVKVAVFEIMGNVPLEESKEARSSPAVVYRNRNITNDVLFYDKDFGSVLHKQWNAPVNLWNPRNGPRATYRQVVMSPSDERLDFFGVAGTTRALHHISWTENSSYSDTNDLGGDYNSIPSPVMTEGSRLDVFAVGEQQYDTVSVLAWIDLNLWLVWFEYFIPRCASGRALDAQPPYILLLVLCSESDVLISEWEVEDDGSLKNVSPVKSIGKGGYKYLVRYGELNV